MKTGVLALQGSYFDHVKSLELIDKEYTLIKSVKEETISYIKTHSKDSILCYMVYDSLNEYKEWSNF